MRTLKFIRFALLAFGLACASMLNGWSATVLSGTISGNWTSNGNPYILVAQSTVPKGSTLTINPGVVVIVAPDVMVTINGSFTALGTEDSPITFRGATQSNYWQSFFFNNNEGTNRFQYCRFSDASYALQVISNGSNFMSGELLNCDFANCRYSAIYAYAQGYGSDTAEFLMGNARLELSIQNCIFSGSGSGCQFTTGGSPNNNNIGFASGSLTIKNSLFKNLAGDAVYTSFVWAGGNSNRVSLLNNSIVNAVHGLFNAGSVQGQDRFDIINNIFSNTGTALQRQSGGDFNAYYNCFFGNSANFVGLPLIYGIPLINNHNRDPADAFSNIFLDPDFNDTSRYLLAGSSPCIDAGDPGLVDSCFRVSKGTSICDIGAYGGPDACTWGRQGFEPGILVPPQNISTCIGMDARFAVVAGGVDPLHYQWYFSATNLLSGKTNASLELDNVDATKAGLYSVLITNVYGSITSTPARLVVFDACVGIGTYAGLSVTGIVGRTYCIQYTTNFASANWTPLATNTLETPFWLYVDTDTPLTTRRFYKVVLKQ